MSKFRSEVKLTQENLASLGAEKLARFILEHIEKDNIFYQSVYSMIECNLYSSNLYNIAIERIKNIFKSKRFYHRGADRELDFEISDIVRLIREDIAPKNIEDAILALQYLVEHGDKIIECVDTSDGSVYPHLQEAVALLGDVWSKFSAAEPKRIAEYVYNRIQENDYGIFDEIIANFKNVLGKRGLSALENLIRLSLVNSDNHYSKRRWSGSLEKIADAEGDVDKYISIIHEFEGKESEYGRVKCSQHLAQAGRAEEALKMLEGIKSSGAWTHDIDSTLIHCYELLNRTEDLRLLYEDKFFDYPTKDRLACILKIVGDTKLNREKYINLALENNPNEYYKIEFLTELEEIERAADLVRKYINNWDGDRYSYLVPAASLLEKQFPLEASILYRALIISILERAKSRYYHHAVTYYNQLQKLSEEITSYHSFDSHEQFIENLNLVHFRKKAFWSQVKFIP